MAEKLSDAARIEALADLSGELSLEIIAGVTGTVQLPRPLRIVVMMKMQALTVLTLMELLV